MPGGGKSTVGKLLARRLQIPFVDIDEVIEQRTGHLVSALFQQGGEAAFRDMESSVLRDVLSTGPAVVATGGGSVLKAENRALIRQASVPVYLHATLPELWRRVRRNSRRPLLQVSDPQARLRDMLAERHPLYCELAAVMVETGEPSMAAVVADIVARLEAIEGAR